MNTVYLLFSQFKGDQIKIEKRYKVKENAYNELDKRIKNSADLMCDVYYWIQEAQTNATKFDDK